MSKSESQTTQGKAREINQDELIYGAFAEIGAGQEVARYFFQAGKASQTIAKTISAYDMIYSDEIYGKEPGGRYVCESRLLKMLDKEYSLLHRRLDKTRGDKTTFFAFANTVATGELSKRQPHGWMGIRFQTKPGGHHNDIVVHGRILDKYRLMQQEVLGVLGVNLVHCAFRHLEKIDDFIPALVENLKESQFTIDMIRFTGPDLQHFNNHLVNLELVRRGLAEAVLFAPDESILSMSDTIYGRPIIIERGRFRPVTNSHLDLLDRGEESFKAAFPKAKKPLEIFELTMHELHVQGKVDESDFLDRVRALAATGHHVMVSNFLEFYKLKRFLRLYTKEPIAMIIGAGLLPRIFEAKYYEDLEGGLLEGLSKLLDPTTRLMVYPLKTGDSCTTAKSYHPDKELLQIYNHFQQHKWILDMAGCDDVAEFVDSDKIAELFKKGDKSWTQHVPAAVAEMIKKENLFNLGGKKSR